MSPIPAAPRIASVSACAITSPSEWPERPRGWSIRTPPSTSGTPSSSACASKPVPTRYSDTRESLRQLVERADRHGPVRRLDVRMRAPTDTDGTQTGRQRGYDVVVDPVADGEGV